jgi:uncharacterized OB-fold protein
VRTGIVPRVTPETAGFWEGTRRGELRAQQCGACGARRFPAQPMCPRCQSFDRAWTPLSGRGTVYSFSIVTGEGPEPPLPGTYGWPYAVVLVELEESVRMLSDADTESLDRLRVDAPVEVFFEPVSEEITVPRFRLTE